MDSVRSTIIILISLFIAGCSSSGGDSGYKWVDSDLQGDWERTEAAFWPDGSTSETSKGTLKLTYNTITINGPFTNFQKYTRGIALEAYTEEKNLHIKDRGEWQPPIPYRYWESAGADKMLTLNGIAVETLKKTPNPPPTEVSQ